MDRDGLLLRFLRPCPIDPMCEEGQLFLISHPLIWGILPQITLKAPKDQVTDHSSPLWNNLVSCKLVAPRMPCPNPLWATGWVVIALLERAHLSWRWTKPSGLPSLIWVCNQGPPILHPCQAAFLFGPGTEALWVGVNTIHSFLIDKEADP